MQPSQRQEVSDTGGGVLLEWERLLVEPETLAAGLIPAGASRRGLSPSFLAFPPCGLNGFHSPLLPLARW